jgi:division protein CdvB (Snf7/Vps24/ESCRT-III family)
LKRWFRRSKKPSTKEKIVIATYMLESTLRKLRVLSGKMKNRDERFFTKAIEAIMVDDSKRAVIYANECAQVRKLARLVIGSELALEQAILRLQTVKEISDIMATVTPILGIVQETKGRLAGIIPSVAGKLNDVNTVLQSSMSEIGSAYHAETQIVASAEAVRVLQEANLAAEEKVREKFPQLPQDLRAPTAEVRVPVALTTNGSTVEMTASSLRTQVYEYIKDCDGRMSIVQCASQLSVGPKEVEEVILQLKEEGKIALS